MLSIDLVLQLFRKFGFSGIVGMTVFLIIYYWKQNLFPANLSIEEISVFGAIVGAICDRSFDLLRKWISQTPSYQLKKLKEQEYLFDQRAKITNKKLEQIKDYEVKGYLSSQEAKELILPIIQELILDETDTNSLPLSNLDLLQAEDDNDSENT